MILGLDLEKTKGLSVLVLPHSACLPRKSCSTKGHWSTRKFHEGETSFLKRTCWTPAKSVNLSHCCQDIVCFPSIYLFI